MTKKIRNDYVCIFQDIGRSDGCGATCMSLVMCWRARPASCTCVSSRWEGYLYIKLKLIYALTCAVMPTLIKLTMLMSVRFQIPGYQKSFEDQTQHHETSGRLQSGTRMVAQHARFQFNHRSRSVARNLFMYIDLNWHCNEKYANESAIRFDYRNVRLFDRFPTACTNK